LNGNKIEDVAIEVDRLFDGPAPCPYVIQALQMLRILRVLLADPFFKHLSLPPLCDNDNAN